MSDYDHIQKLRDWKKVGFDTRWLLSLKNCPATSAKCGLTGHAATSVIKNLEYIGGLKRGKIQPNHKRLWLPGVHYDKWYEAAETILATSQE